MGDTVVNEAQRRTDLVEDMEPLLIGDRRGMRALEMVKAPDLLVKSKILRST